MKIDIITTTIKNGVTEITTEKNVDKNDLRLEMLKNVKTIHNTWRILDFYFDYSCSQTKFGFKVTETFRLHKNRTEQVTTKFIYN